MPTCTTLQQDVRENEMFRKILLAYDGSAGAKKALNVALELANLSGGGFTPLN